MIQKRYSSFEVCRNNQENLNSIVCIKQTLPNPVISSSVCLILSQKMKYVDPSKSRSKNLRSIFEQTRCNNRNFCGDRNLITKVLNWLSFCIHIVGDAWRLCMVGDAWRLCMVGDAWRLYMVGDAWRLCMVEEPEGCVWWEMLEGCVSVYVKEQCTQVAGFLMKLCQCLWLFYRISALIF